jgi:hypothetical protein
MHRTMAGAAEAVRRTTKRVLDIRWPLRGVGCAGAVAIVVATFFCAGRAGVSFPNWIPSAVSAAAGWFCLVVLVIMGWEAKRVAERQPPLELTEREPATWRRWWIAPLVLSVGVVIGWQIFT